MLKEKIAVWVDEVIDDNGLYLVEVRESANHFFQIFIDGDNGVNIEDCRKISRHLESYLDENSAIKDNYKLDVSSFGVGNPLLLNRQYQSNIGRHLFLTLEESQTKEGIIKEVKEESIIITEKIQSKSNKKQFVDNDIEIKFKDIEKAIVKVLFK